MSIPKSSPYTVQTTIKATCQRLFPNLLDSMLKRDLNSPTPSLEEIVPIDNLNSLKVVLSIEESNQKGSHPGLDSESVLLNMLQGRRFSFDCQTLYFQGFPISYQEHFQLNPQDKTCISLVKLNVNLLVRKHGVKMVAS